MQETLPGAGRGRRQAGRGPPRGSRLGNAGLALVSLLVTLAMLEAGYRIAAGLPVFEFPNWRFDRTIVHEKSEIPIPDPVLGWVSRPGHVSEGYNTLDHGIRRNHGETAVRTGALLAVGDSFTEGLEVEDDETWPAHLEKLIGKPVVNGGVMAYATDQIILRAEQLLPVVKPRVLIVGFLEFDVYRAGHTHFGSPKPYFTVENGALRYHPPALVKVRERGGFAVRAGYEIRDVLGYFASIDYLLHRVAPDFWLGDEKQQYLKAPNDPVQVTCLLLERLKQRTDRDRIRMLLFLQHYAASILEADEPSGNAQAVSACATKLGIQVVDQFASLRAIVDKKREALRAYYVAGATDFTHMSSDGNKHAAQLLAKALGD
jgi:hypothetical protein